MNKDQFWRIVDDVRTGADPRDQGAILPALRDPESLAEVDTEGQSLHFEQYAYASYKAHAQSRAYEAGPLTDVIREYINWAAQYGQQVLDRLMRASPHEKDLSAGVAKRNTAITKEVIRIDAEPITRGRQAHGLPALSLQGKEWLWLCSLIGKPASEQWTNTERGVRNRTPRS